MRRIFPVALGIAVLVSALGLLSRAWFEVSSGYLASDTLLFQTVGRGILNGYIPYADLFETKPPGILLLHALSWKLFDSQLLVKIVQAIVLLGIAVRFMIPALDAIASRPAAQRRTLSMLSLLFGILLAQYAGNQAGLGLVESYGAFVSILFIVVAISSMRWKKTRYAVLGVLLLFAVGLKEPFLFSILGALVLLIPDWKEVVKTIGIPLGIAAVVGVVALLALGYFEAFFGVYLKHMLSFHVHQHDGSTFVRALEVWRTFINIGAYSWWFAAGVTVVWLYVPVRSVLVRDWLFVVRWALSSYLMFLSIATGGDFYGHHFVFGVPVMAALFWTALRMLPEHPHRLLLPGISLLLVVSAIADAKLSYAAETKTWRTTEAQLIASATVIDDIMERCGWERYLQMIPRGGGPYAYTKASPYGPIFTHYERFLGASRQYQSAYIKALKETPFMLLIDLENSNLSEFALQYVGVHFSEEPPACAGEDFVQPEPYYLLFQQQ